MLLLVRFEEQWFHEGDVGREGRTQEDALVTVLVYFLHKPKPVNHQTTPKPANMNTNE